MSRGGSTNMANKTRTRARSLILIAAFILLFAACGGGSDDSSVSSSTDDTGAEAGSESTAADSIDTGGPVIAFDAGALGTTPLQLADIRVFEPGVDATRTVTVDAVVDTCSLLSGADLSAIVQTLSEEEAFGDGPVFADGELLGAECTYVSDTHAVSLVAGPIDQVNPDAATLITPIAAGDLMAIPWSSDGAITVLSENSFDLDTPFAAHSASGDVGIFALNSGGTGIDFGSRGELFARMASAAATNVASAGPAVPLDESLNIQTAQPCALLNAEEVDAFFVDYALLPNEAGDLSEVGDGGTTCAWGSFNGGVELRIDIEHASTAEDRPDAMVSELSQAVRTDVFGSYITTDIATVRIRVNINEPLSGSGSADTRGATEALAENIAVRLGL